MHTRTSAKRKKKRSLLKQGLLGAGIAAPGYAVAIPTAMAGGLIENPTGIPFGDRFKYTNPARMSSKVGKVVGKINRVRNFALIPAAAGTGIAAHAAYKAYKKRKRKRK